MNIDISVTRLLLVNRQKEVYLLLRNGKGSGGIKRWITPGGKVDAGETPVDCLIRETKEETGLEISKKNIIELHKEYDPVFKAMMYFYYCLDWKGTPVIKETDKFDRAAWVKPSEVSRIVKKDEHIGILIEKACDLLVTELKKTKRPPVYSTW